MKNNIKNLWIKKFVLESDKNVLLDSAILMNPRVWEASGHLGGFSDMLTDCKNCKLRFRADKLIEQNNLEFNSNDSQKAESFIKENIITLCITVVLIALEIIALKKMKYEKLNL